MALFNYATKEITLKIVFYGPGLSGKTTNLLQLHSILDPSKTGKFLSLATETDRTLFFDFLPVDIGKIKDFIIRFQLYTVPGQVQYNATRKVVLKGADGVVFVADSQRDLREANLESFVNMRENLIANNINPDDIPIVFQYNKRDLPDIFTIDELNRDLNSTDQVYLEAEAINGKGVQETFQIITKLIIKDIAQKHKLEIQPAAPPKETARVAHEEVFEKPADKLEEVLPAEILQPSAASEASAFEEIAHQLEEVTQPSYIASSTEIEGTVPMEETLRPLSYSESPAVEEIFPIEESFQASTYFESSLIEETVPAEESEQPTSLVQPNIEETFQPPPPQQKQVIREALLIEEPAQPLVSRLEVPEKEGMQRTIIKEVSVFPTEKLGKMAENLRETSQLLISTKVELKRLSEDLKKIKDDQKEIINFLIKLNGTVEKLEREQKKKKGWFG